MNLFISGVAKIANKISLHKYLIYTMENLNKVLPYSDQKNDKSNKTDLNLNNENI